MNSYWKVVWIVFALFVVSNLAYLHRVPGFMGDEGSEGENVYELLRREGITVTGERSYIGPAIDYIRVPFIYIFNYTSLALRVPMFLFSVATFFLARSVLQKQFGDTVSLWALVALVFSPIYLLQQRIGWATTLSPFFVFLILWMAQQKWKYSWPLVGLVAGIGLANHILFFPTLIGLLVGSVLLKVLTKTVSLNLYSLFLVALGFWAGFAMQFAVLQLQVDDQGDPTAVAQVVSERWNALPRALPLYLSGSSYSAEYVGQEFHPTTILLVTIAISIGAVLAFLFAHRPLVWVWGVGIVVQLVALMYMIDRFSLRYFVVTALGVWLLAGIGVGTLVDRLQKAPRQWIEYGLACIAAALLIVATTFSTLIPYLLTGGSTASFDLGNRTSSANALVDVRGLVTCLRGQGPVYSENVHIWNRLQYLSHRYENLIVFPEEYKKEAKILVSYRDEKNPQPGDICPHLLHFSVRKI